MTKIILDLCGGTGAWSRPYAEAGYDVRVIDILNTQIYIVNNELHNAKSIKQVAENSQRIGKDVRLFTPPENVYGVLAAPPCTHLAGSGARWWAEKGDGALLEALSVVDACLRIVLISRPKFWALENPVGRLVNYLGPPRMYFHPCDYGDPWTKKTALWGKFNEPEKNYVEPVPNANQDNKISQPVINGKKIGWNSPETRLLRSITPPSFAKAFFEANP